LFCLAHIELNAVHLYMDTAARFAGRDLPVDGLGAADVPPAFFAECVGVARDEARHLQWLRTRLAALDGGAFVYGDCLPEDVEPAGPAARGATQQQQGQGERVWSGGLPVHGGLWSDALATKDSLLGRIALLPLVQEARALDSEARLAHKLESMGDRISADMVRQICAEEVGHVAMGHKYFSLLVERSRLHRGRSPAAVFQDCVRLYARSPFLPRPFNAAARHSAGMTSEWYEPLARPDKPKHTEQKLNDAIN
jgi:uncharacterized ferritin-like protein (DUF455 family)